MCRDCETQPIATFPGNTDIRKTGFVLLNLDFKRVFYSFSLFNDLPTAFQCKIASDVTFASRGDATKAALAETMAKISKELKTLDKTLSCTETHPREIITNTRVQIGVRLRKSLPLDAWLERFKRIMPTIYLSYISKTGRVSEFATGWRTNKKGVKIPIIPFDKFLVNFYDQPITDASVAMVSFSLFSRTESGDYRLINGDEVAASFDGLSRSVLNSYIQAEVIGWQAHREKGNNQRLERTRKRNSKPSLLQSYRLQTWFPKYLLNFFKSMSSNGRCYILRQISSYVEQDLLVVEKWYNWLGQLPKKYYCSRASKYVAKTKNKHPKPLRSIWDRLDKYIQMIQTISSVAPTLRLGTTISQARNSTVVRETRPFNSMEIVMFALLGFLCLLIMVFVGNCVVFTFKTKQLNNEYFSDFQSPQFVYDGAKDCDLVSADHAPEKLPVTENPQQATGGKDSDNHHHWRLLSLTSEGRATVCSDLLSLSEEESERVSSV